MFAGADEAAVAHLEQSLAALRDEDFFVAAPDGGGPLRDFGAASFLARVAAVTRNASGVARSELDALGPGA